MPETSVTRDLLAWYDGHRRTLPWRAPPGETADPYAVWLSEIMLQQTTVRAVIPFYAKFLAAWPSVEALAAASLEDVLRAWAGLGYYSRARNLHACARTVVERHGGRFPDAQDALRELPGIGDYTSAAIAAIAFGRPAAVVDGNVERVMARLHAIATPLPQARPAMRAAMAACTPQDRPGDFAQAVMDLGATICTPRRPACTICPIAPACAARQAGAQADFPRRLPKRSKPVRHGTAFYIENDRGEVLVRRRPAAGLLGGMTELPGTDWIEGRAQPDLLAVPGSRHVGRVQHVFTHFTLWLDVLVSCPVSSMSLEKFGPARWVPAEALAREALPTLMRNAIALAQAAITGADQPPASACSELDLQDLSRRDPRPPASRRRRRS